LNQEPLALDLFPEMPAPVIAPRQRAAKPKTGPRVEGPSRSNNAKDPNPAAAHNNPTLAPDDPETLARTLESHTDYRVLRRLQPRLVWPPNAPGETSQTSDTVTVVVLDTETTGLDAAKERIIELAMLRVEVNLATGMPVGVVQIYDGLEDPGKPIPKEVVALTGIRDADVQGQRLDEAQVSRMLEGVDLVIAHNAGFDRPFVEKRLARFAELRWSCSVADIDWKQQGRSSAKLENLALAMGWFYDAHRAEMDCHALLAVLATPLPHASHTGLAHLHRAASAPSFRLQATNAPFDAKDLIKARGYRWNADQKVWHTRLADEGALNVECEWLKDNAYGGRAARVVVEELDAWVRFSNRPGVLTQRQL
jgi:DNA polymerase-3 subunit epsilon